MISNEYRRLKLKYNNSLVPLEMRNKAVSLSFTFVVHLTMNSSDFNYIFTLVFFFFPKASPRPPSIPRSPRDARVAFDSVPVFGNTF